MVRSKREFVCTNCKAKALRWEGICRSCGLAATLEEVILVRTPIQLAASDKTRKLARRAKDSERKIAKRMTAIDGVDPAFKNIASSTGRIGQITGIRVDAVSKSYVTENKNRKMPKWLIDAWLLINQRGHDFNKNVLLHVEPPNMPKAYKINGMTVKLDTMAIIPQSRHEELILLERALHTLLSDLSETSTSDALINKALQTMNGQDVSSK